MPREVTMSARPVPPFAYMEWAKARTPGPRFNLAQSGAPSLAASDLGLDLADLRLTQDGGYGDRTLLAALSDRYGVPREEIVLASGSSLANALIVMTLLESGDVVLVERPCYESLATLPRLQGAEVRFADRTPETRWAIPVDAIEAGLADGARLVVLTDFHNPSGTPARDEDLRRVAAAAERADAWVLVDEVYRDFLPGPVSTTRRLGERILATSSLTKVYGLGGLRAGWAFVPPDLAADMLRLHDYLGVVFPPPCAVMAVAALARAEAIRNAHRELGRRGYAIVREWIDGREDVEVLDPGPALICFPRITSGVDTAALVTTLEREAETTVVPGEAFDMPGYLRIGFGLPEETLREGLRRLGQALDDRRAS
jgi:aspartate/methionine/tyrosine aminotransferase